RKIINAALHNGPQILDHGTACMTGSVHPQLNFSFLKVDQLPPAVEFSKTPSQGIERLQNTGFQVIGVQRIEKKQVADNRILTELVNHGPHRRSGFTS